MKIRRLRTRRARREAELDRELLDGLDLEAEEQQAAGLSSEEARYAARRAFGNAARIKEEVRMTWGFRWLETLLQDLTYGARQLRRNPGFAAAVVLSLALGIGANTAIFSLIDAVMLRTLPVKSPQRLVLLNWSRWKGRTNTDVLAVQSDNGAQNDSPISYPAFQHLRARNNVFSSLFGFVSLGKTEIGARGPASLVNGEMVTGGYFSGLGVNPVLGRGITAQDQKPGAPGAAVISSGYWSRAFGRNPKILGQNITVDGVPFTIVGVAPPEFFGVQPGRAVDLWVPITGNAKLLPYGMDSTPGGRPLFTSRDWWWLLVMGRLKPGVAAHQATAQVNLLFRQSVTAGLKVLPRSVPHLQLDAAARGIALLREQFSKPLTVLMVLVGVVLLIACANVAGLLVARSAARQNEIAVRLSLGAPRWRLIRQLLTESVLLSGCGGALGLLFAAWGSRALLLLMSKGGAPLNVELRLNMTVLAFTAAISIATGILFGLTPALRSTRVSLAPSLKISAGAGSAANQRTWLGSGKALVVAQVALSLVLLIGAGLFLRTLENLENQNLGFDQRHLLLFSIDPTTDGYKGQRLIDFYGQMLARLQTLSGVRSASMSENALISGQQGEWGISIDGHNTRSGHLSYVQFNVVGPSFFQTMGIRLLVGRGVGWRDTPASPEVAVANEAFAHRYLNGGDPVGHSFRFGYYNFRAGEFSPAYEIVGMVQNAKYASLREASFPTIYLPYTQAPFPIGGMHFELRTAGDPLAVVPSVRQAIQRLSRDLPISEVKTQTEQIDEALVNERAFARLSSFFGGLAVLLACIGLYSLMVYAVTRRTHDFGIRMALGAERRDILKMVMRETMALAALGIALGIPAALAASRLVSSFLYGLKPSDPLTIAAAAGIMIAVTALAGFVPARRAAHLDPMAALRYE